jgi:hypothetical protein
MKYQFWEEHFVTLHFLSWFILSYMIFYDIFVFFYFIQKKCIFIKYFFTINVPINYPPLSKKHIKLSKNYPFFQNRSQKIWKNPEKIHFFHFFLMVSVAILSKVVSPFIMWKWEKNVSKKSWKKNDFHFCKLFF